MARRFRASAVLSRVPAMVAGALLGTALAAVVAARLPPTYEAEAALLVELAPGTAEGLPALDFDASDGLPLLDQRIQARAISAEAAGRLGRDVPFTGRALPVSAARAQSEEADAPVPMPPSEGTQARIVTVGLEARSPQRAAAATNEMVGLLLREAAERRRGAEVSPPPPPEEVERLAGEVASRSAALRTFLAEHAGALPDTAAARRGELAAEETRREELARADAALRDPGAVADPSPPPDLPDDGAADADLAARHDIVGRQTAEAEARIAELRASLEATDANAGRLAALREEFDALRSEFDRATQRHLAAQAGGLVAILAGSPRVSVIALAVPPAAPAGPNRPLILVGGLLGGLLLGIVLAVTLDARDRSIRHPEELATRLGIEPFAVLPVLGRGRGRGRRLGVAAVFLLALLAGGLWAIHVWVVPLDLLVGRLLAATRATGPGDG